MTELLESEILAILEENDFEVVQINRKHFTKDIIDVIDLQTSVDYHCIICRTDSGYNDQFLAYRAIVSKYNAKMIRYFRVGNQALCIIEKFPTNVMDKLETNGALTGNDLRYCAYCLLQSLSIFHSNGFVHQDIRPANIFIDKNGDYKLGSYFFTKKLRKNDETINVANGNLLYFSPEKLESKSYDPMAADVYAAGITLLYIATDVLPYGVQNRYDLIDGIKSQNFSVDFDMNNSFYQLISEMLVLDPKDRIKAKDALNHEFFTTKQDLSGYSGLKLHNRSSYLGTGFRRLSYMNKRQHSTIVPDDLNLSKKRIRAMRFSTHVQLPKLKL